MKDESETFGLSRMMFPLTELASILRDRAIITRILF